MGKGGCLGVICNGKQDCVSLMLKNVDRLDMGTFVGPLCVCRFSCMLYRAQCYVCMIFCLSHAHIYFVAVF